MSPNLRDLLHELADHETGVPTPDTTTEVRRIMTDIRTRRTRRFAVVGAAAVTVLAVGVATATALTPAPRDPAVDPGPSPTATPDPTPTISSTPSPAPTSAPEAYDEPASWGVVDSLATAPQPLWSLASRAVPSSSGTLGPSTSFVDVHSGAPYGGVGMIRAGDVLVSSVTTEDGSPALIGVGVATGAVLWIDDTDEGGRTSGVCGGVTDEGLVACRAGTYGDASAVDLVDPTDGTVVRSLPLGFSIDSLGVAGSTIVAHGTTDRTTARWDGIDAATGAALWSHVEPGASSDEEIFGDVFAYTRVDGHYARLFSYGYQAVVDTRTGERAPEGAPHVWADVWAPGEGVVVPELVVEDVRDDDSGEVLSSRLRARDPATGSELWVYESASSALVGVVGDGALVSHDGSLVQLDLATGRVRWTIEDTGVLATDGERILTAPADSQDLRARSLADGSVLWSLPGSSGPTFGSWLDRRHVVLGLDDTARMFAW